MWLKGTIENLIQKNTDSSFDSLDTTILNLREWTEKKYVYDPSESWTMAQTSGSEYEAQPDFFYNLVRLGNVMAWLKYQVYMNWRKMTKYRVY